MKSGRLLYATILLVALMAPPAYPQKVQDQLNTLMTDMINLKNSVSRFQENSDQKNAELRTMVEQVLSRFSALDSSLQSLGNTLGAIKADGEKTHREQQQDLQSLRTQLGAVQKTSGEVIESLAGLRTQVGGFGRQIAEMKAVEEPLPSAAVLFSQAFGDYSAGIYGEAITGFNDVLSQYPRDERAGAAAFYIGEAHFAQKKFEDSVTDYDRVLQTYPASDKRCTALYKKGRALVALKRNSEAKTQYEVTQKECPDTPEAANATSELKELAPPPQSRGRGNR